MSLIAHLGTAALRLEVGLTALSRKRPGLRGNFHASPDS
jgi:hypothetical protein